MNKIDIIIPTFNTLKMTENCVLSIIKNIDNATITVVDNGTDGTGYYLHDKYGVQAIINKDNKGYAKACNLGIKHTYSDYILLLNSDTLMIQKKCLDEMIKMFDNKKVAVVGPKLINENKRIVGCGVIGTDNNQRIRGWLEQDNGQYNEPIECLSVCGACYLIKRSNIKELGLFDENYPFYFEETDYSLNARKHGYKIMYCPYATVIHYHQGSCKDRQTLLKYFAESQHRYNEKYPETRKVNNNVKGINISWRERHKALSAN